MEVINFNMVYIFIIGVSICALAYFLYDCFYSSISDMENEADNNNKYSLRIALLKTVTFFALIITLIVGIYIILFDLTLITFYIASIIFDSFSSENIIEYKDCLTAVVQIVTLLGSVMTASFAYLFKIKNNKSKKLIKQSNQNQESYDLNTINHKKEQEFKEESKKNDKEEAMKVNEYIKNRLDDQIIWYSNKSKYYKKFYYGFSISLLVISSLSTIVSYLALKYKSIDFLPILSTILTTIVPVIIGIDKLMKCQELYTNYRHTCERLKQEKIFFLNKVGEYSNLSNEKSSMLLVTRCESIMATENSNWTQLNEKKKD